jgi:hypothetical protein
MGGKAKNPAPINQGPYSIAEPAYKPMGANLGGGTATTYGPMPGQLDLIAQQLHAGYPTMDQAALLAQLQGIYKPVTTGGPVRDEQAALAAATAKAAAASAPTAATKTASASAPTAANSYGRYYVDENGFFIDSARRGM